jgi:predicted KAP-like P-loop ATPase
METIINTINNAYNNVLITPDGTVYQNDDILNLKSKTEENIFDLVNNSAKFGNTEYAVEESDDKSKLTFVEKTTQTSPQVNLSMSVEDFVATLSSDV